MSDMADVLTLHAFHMITPADLDDMNGPWQVECNCDSDPIQGHSFLAAEQAFAAHQSAALSAAGFGPVQEARAEAWDEGCEEATEHYAAHAYDPNSNGPVGPPTNPYREDA